MLDRLIRSALAHPVLVLSSAALLLLVGPAWILGMPVDIFPDLSAPSVTVVTEARGLAPEEVEQLVTFPLESGLNGLPGIWRVRSVSAAGIAVVWAEFAWGEDVYRARQMVAERLQAIPLPAQASPPALGPISSIMGEIAFVALTSDTPAVSAMDLRTVAETTIRRRLLAIPGISQVVPIGGERKEVQIELDAIAMAQHGASVDEVVDAVRTASATAAAGFHVDGGQEYLVRGMGRAREPADLGHGVVRVREGVPLRVSDLGQVRAGAEPRRGTASYRASPAVVLSVQKQPGANTLDLTREMDRVLADLARTLPKGIRIETENFRQADFIEVAVRNVAAALRDGALLVILILVLFLGNVRTTLISALALPLSLVAGTLLVRWTGGSINTMTLGGLTIAIGALVDDAIIDVENVFRRLRENRLRPESERRPALEVVFRASSEVRQAIFFATLIIAVVFLPVAFLPGLEGRLLRPLAGAYVAALAASLLVSLTVTPVLCRLLLPHSRALDRPETPVLRAIRRLYGPVLGAALRRPRVVLAATLVLVAGAVAALPFLGRSFLPPFNEGSLTVSVVSAPGVTLEESDRLGSEVEKTLLSFEEVVSTSRRTGRAEKDEHVQGVNASEMEVVLRPGRPRGQLLADMRVAVATIPGVSVSFGQPISHRIDHMISGSKSNLAVKVFGPDLSVLRSVAGAAQRMLAAVSGVTDLSNAEQAPVSQLLLDLDRDALARHGLTAEAMARSIEALFQGTEAGEIVIQGLVSRVVVRFPERLRRDRELIGSLPVTTPSGGQVRLDEVARVRFALGPSLVRRENVERLAMLSANLEGTDLAGAVARVRRTLDSALDLPPGYRIELGGQFEEAERGARTLLLLGVVLVIVIGGLLYVALRGHRHAAIVLVNLPLALIGGVFAVALSDRVLSIAATVGFITLFGIATRNGVLLVSHYQHLMREDGLPLHEAVRRGSMERLAPVLMTALTAALALIPLIWAGAEPGNEIQSPMARVILGGLLTSTFLNMIVVPVLFERWGAGERRAS
jgi:CzcA family heavy metal efflux pump